MEKSVGFQQNKSKERFTYLLSHPFPEEEIILGETKEKVLRSLYKGKNPHTISKEVNIKRPTTIQHLKELREKGLVKKGKNDENKYGELWFVTDKGAYLVEKSVGFPIDSSHKGLTESKKTRGHAFIWKIKPSKKLNWKLILEKLQIPYQEKGIAQTPRIILNKKKVWLGKANITIFEPKWNSFFNKTPIKSRNDAVYEMIRDIDDLKEKLQIDFKYKFTCRRQHYGFVDNQEARFFIKKKQKILIKNEKGYWFSIDFSQNKYKEAETIHEEDAMIDGMGYQNLMNSHEKTKFKVTPEFILTNINKLIQNQEHQTKDISAFAIALNRHIPAYERMGNFTEKLMKEFRLFRKENTSWRKNKVKEIRNELKFGKQTKLGGWF